MTDSMLLKERINLSGYKLGYIAEQLGISRYSLYQKVGNKREFSISEMLKLCEILNIEKEERDEIFFAQKGDKLSLIRA